MSTKIQPDTIARTICLILALVNQVLAICGKGTFEFANDDVYQVVSLIFTLGTSLLAWWKNNSFTVSAIKADDIMRRLKVGDCNDSGSSN